MQIFDKNVVMKASQSAYNVFYNIFILSTRIVFKDLIKQAQLNTQISVHPTITNMAATGSAMFTTSLHCFFSALAGIGMFDD